MTLQEFSRDIVPILGLGTILLVFWQLYRTNKWNQYNFTYNILNSGKIEELESNVIALFKAKDINIVSKKSIGEPILELIKNDQGLNNAISIYLSFLEKFCIAINHNAVDEEIAFDALSENIVRSWVRYKIYIGWYREDGDAIYSGLEKQAKLWMPKIKL